MCIKINTLYIISDWAFFSSIHRKSVALKIKKHNTCVRYRLVPDEVTYLNCLVEGRHSTTVPLKTELAPESKFLDSD